MRNLQEQVKKALCYQELFWTFTIWINCSSELKNFANSQPSALNFKSFSRSLEQFFLTVVQNNFGNKIPFKPFNWRLLLVIWHVAILRIFCAFFFRLRRRKWRSLLWSASMCSWQIPMRLWSLHQRKFEMRRWTGLSRSQRWIGM